MCGPCFLLTASWALFSPNCSGCGKLVNHPAAGLDISISPCVRVTNSHTKCKHSSKLVIGLHIRTCLGSPPEIIENKKLSIPIPVTLMRENVLLVSLCVIGTHALCFSAGTVYFEHQNSFLIVSKFCTLLFYFCVILSYVYGSKHDSSVYM